MVKMVWAAVAAQAIAQHKRHRLLIPGTVVLAMALILLNIPTPPPAPRPVYDLQDLKAIRIPDREITDIVQSLEVASAYAMTNVKFASFDYRLAKMPRHEAEYLARLFDLVNKGVVERVQWFTILKDGLDYSKIADNHAQILIRMHALKVPPALEKIHYLILNAISEEEAYFMQWKSTPDMVFNHRDPLVRSAHLKLLAAYDELMQRYPDEDARIRQSFYSHLCALSFI